jgi:hypothetical protein
MTAVFMHMGVFFSNWCSFAAQRSKAFMAGLESVPPACSLLFILQAKRSENYIRPRLFSSLLFSSLGMQMAQFVMLWMLSV